MQLCSPTKDECSISRDRLGFKSVTTVEKVCDAFPELDMVNHVNRARLVSEEQTDRSLLLVLNEHRLLFQSQMMQMQGLVRDENFRPIEGEIFVLGCSRIDHSSSLSAVLLLGEPIHWESSLQVIVDLLLTNGNPAVVDGSGERIDGTHLPVIACNRDLVFKAAADLPRFGHGAFLTCLEVLYKVSDSKLLACHTVTRSRVES